MISHRMQTTPVAGYYEYLSRNRHRVNVAPSEESMTETTNTNSPIVSTVIEENTVSVVRTSPSDNIQEQSQTVSKKDVTEWSSTEVQHWIEEQCQKFELKKATTEKFQLNGQALVLLTKHDFLRRSPDGGEILYYALQRMINPNKSDSTRTNSNFTRNNSARQSTRIIEIGSDSDEHSSVTGNSPSSKPIIEEPDDPPLQRKSESDSINDNYPHQHYPRSYFRTHPHMQQPVFTAPTAAYYYQQQQQHAQAYPNTFVYTHPHVPQQQFYHAQPHVHFIHQYQPMMAAQGILIELIDHEEAKNLLANGANSSLNDNGVNIDAIQGQLYLITMNGQRYIMNEEQIRHYANEFQQQQQQQQHFQHQMYHQQQQQQHFQHQMFHQHQQQQQQPQQQHHQTSQDNIFYTTS